MTSNVRGGFFISFEGIDGAGKSTQVDALAQTLRERGHAVVVLRPGDTRLGADCDRYLLAARDATPLDPWTEALLFVAQRVQLWRERVEPALRDGAVVIVDRWADSTRAYQGGGRGLDRDLLARLHDAAVDGAWPHLTLLLDVELGTAQRRRTAAAPELDRIAASPASFHAAVRDEFRRIAAEHPERVVVVDTSAPPDEVAARVAEVTLGRLGTPVAFTP